MEVSVVPGKARDQQELIWPSCGANGPHDSADAVRLPHLWRAGEVLQDQAGEGGLGTQSDARFDSRFMHRCPCATLREHTPLLNPKGHWPTSRP
eukprot:5656352-Amphidinium_carterae.1